MSKTQPQVTTMFWYKWQQGASFVSLCALGSFLLLILYRFGLETDLTVPSLLISVLVSIVYFPFLLPAKLLTKIESQPHLAPFLLLPAIFMPFLIYQAVGIGKFIFPMIAITAFIRSKSYSKYNEKSEYNNDSINRIIYIYFIVFWSIYAFGRSIFTSNVYYKELISEGMGPTDTLYHAAISNLFAFFNTPSLGVSGVDFYSYHAGVNLWIGAISSAIDSPNYITYSLSSLLVFIPLTIFMFISVPQCMHLDKEKKLFSIELIIRMSVVITFLCLTKGYLFIHINNPLPLTLILITIPCIVYLINDLNIEIKLFYTYVFILSLYMPVLVYFKMSIGYLYCALIFITFILSKHFSRRTAPFLLIFMCGAGALLFLTRMDDFLLLFKDFEYLLPYRDRGNWPYLSLFAFFTMFFLLLSAQGLPWRQPSKFWHAVISGQAAVFSIILIVSVSAVLPTLLFDLGGGSSENSLLFLDATFFITLSLTKFNKWTPLLVTGCTQVSRHKLFHISGTLLIGTLSVFLFGKYLQTPYELIKEEIKARPEMLRVETMPQSTATFLKASILSSGVSTRDLFEEISAATLMGHYGQQLFKTAEAQTREYRGKLAVYVPRSNANYWNWTKNIPCRIESYYWQALHGLPVFFSITGRCQYEATKFYQRPDIWPENGDVESTTLCQLAKSRGLSGVYVFNDAQSMDRNQILWCKAE